MRFVFYQSCRYSKAMSFMQLAKLKRLAKKNESSEKEETRREVKQVVIDKVTVKLVYEKVSSSVEEKNLADFISFLRPYNKFFCVKIYILS